MATSFLPELAGHSRHRTAGGRTAARRWRSIVIASLSLVLPQGPLGAETGERQPDVVVRQEQGVYYVEARFTVPQRGSVAFDVLTDYERIPRFMPDVQTSTVLERTEGRTVVEQQAIARFMMFSKRVHLVLEVIEEPTLIRFRDRCGKTFAQYEGVWQVRDQDQGATISYQLTAKPSFDLPEFLLKRLLKRDAREMIERLQAEIAARAMKSQPSPS